MSLPTHGLAVDYVLAVDPGYATQGICVIDKAGNIRQFFSSVTTAGLGVHQRALWQIFQIQQVLDSFGPNCLLVVEEFHARAGGVVSPTSVYNRGWYDALLRDRIGHRVRYSITAHNSAVWAFSEPVRVYERVEGKTRKQWIKPTAEEILRYNFAMWPWLRPQDPSPLDYWERLESRHRDADGKLNSIESNDKSKMHATDALVMAGMGFVSCLRPEFIYRCTEKQRKWIIGIHGTYTFEKDQEAGVR